MTDKISNEQLEKLQREAGLPNRPTRLTFEARHAVYDTPVLDGLMHYNWADKPHRVVYELCAAIEAQEVELRSYRTASNPLREVADGVAAAQKRIEELGLVGVPLIDSMSDEEFAADRSGENPNAGTPAPVSEITEEMVDPSFPDALKDSEVRIWIANCNHEPARQALRQLLAYRVRGVSTALTAAMGGK